MKHNSETAEQFFEWLQGYIVQEFSYLVNQIGFTLEKNNIIQNQLSVEYTKNDTTIGFWCCLGTRPEIYIKSGSKKIFTDELRKLTKIQEPFPINSNVFGGRLIKSDYTVILKYYDNVIDKWLTG